MRYAALILILASATAWADSPDAGAPAAVAEPAPVVVEPAEPVPVVAAPPVVTPSDASAPAAPATAPAEPQVPAAPATAVTAPATEAPAPTPTVSAAPEESEMTLWYGVGAAFVALVAAILALVRYKRKQKQNA